MTAPRVIAVHLTPFAPGCATWSLNDRRRNRDFYRPLPVVLRATLARLGRAPGDVIAGLRGDEPALLGHVEGQPGPVALAMIWDGAAIDEIRAALAALVAEGWSPPARPAGPPTPSRFHTPTHEGAPA